MRELASLFYCSLPEQITNLFLDILSSHSHTYSPTIGGKNEEEWLSCCWISIIIPMAIIIAPPKTYKIVYLINIYFSCQLRAQQFSSSHDSMSMLAADKLLAVYSLVKHRQQREKALFFGRRENMIFLADKKERTLNLYKNFHQSSSIVCFLCAAQAEGQG